MSDGSFLSSKFKYVIPASFSICFRIIVGTPAMAFINGSQLPVVTLYVVLAPETTLLVVDVGPPFAASVVAIVPVSSTV